jgi:peptidoglycan hydrolase-like protein with peptidoglycan-binding domain
MARVPASGAESVVESTTTDGVKPLPTGWGRLVQGNRVIWVIAVVAVLSLLAGIALSRFIISPAEAASNAAAPEGGLITVPVEFRALSNNVTIRGDANFADSVDVTIETGDLGGPAVVTGQVPAVGASLGPASVALEVVGRPVIVLPGDLPVYRTLRVGVSGPDVLQLKQALQSLGINPGDVSSNVFDSATAAGVAALYAAVGYPAPASPDGTKENIASAQEGVANALDNLTAAQLALQQAKGGPSQVDIIEQANLVAAAERAVEDADCDIDPNTNECLEALEALALAQAVRDQVLAPGNTSAESAAVASANRALTAARALLTEAQQGALTYLPSSEVLYLPSLPRRVDEVSVSRGSIVTTSVMRVSGATLVVEASAADTDAKLLAVGDRAIMSMPDGTEHGATITVIEPHKSDTGATDASRFDVLLEPDELTVEQLQGLQGNNVKITIAVGETDGEVLAVPLAALTAGAGGEARVEVVDPTGDGTETILIEVTTGLAADGFVEITPVEGKLEEDDLVVVGR